MREACKVFAILAAAIILLGLAADSDYIAIQFRNESGTPYGIKQVGNKPRVSSMPYLYDIAENNIADHTALRKFGHNDDVAATEETVWDGSTAYWYLSAAETLKVDSTDADDTTGDTGARTILLKGLDGNWDEINETITLAGTSVTTTANSYLRVFRARVVTAGGSETNEGNILVKDNSETTTLLQISAGRGQTLMALWTVPNGKNAFVTLLYTGTSSNKVTEIGLYTRTDGEAWNIKKMLEVNQTASQINYSLPLMVVEKTDIEIRALSTAGGGHVAAGFDLWYEDE